MNLFRKNRSMGRSPFHREPSNFQIKAAEGEILLYDEIGYWGISADEFVRALDEIKTDEVLVRINSPGGEVFDGTAIFNAIRNDSRKITTQIDGMAVSMASGIAMAGDEVRMADNAFFMIHNPWSIAIGDAADLRKEADLLDKIGKTLGSSYAKKSGMSIEDIMALMAEETWYNGVEAKEAGFVDEVFGIEPENEPSALFDLSVFDNVPAAMKRRIEGSLRDAGCSKSEAKIAASKGFQSVHREDVEPGHCDDDQIMDAIESANDLIENIKSSIRN